MIDFAKLTGIEHNGKVVTQITDSAGRVLWAVQSNVPIVLEVEKVISNTYAGETTYENEEFILLDIYPKTNGTVSVTYGGLTKTITDTSGAEEPNSQTVFFGTFNGVSDSVATPTSGELTIEGDYRGVGVGDFYTDSKGVSKACVCVIAITDLGKSECIPVCAYSSLLGGASCTEITNVTIPASVKTIETSAFKGCTGLTSVTICEGVSKIYGSAFQGCTGLTSVTIPTSVANIFSNPFAECFHDNGITVKSGNTMYKIDGNCLIENTSNVLIAGYADGVIPPYVKTIGTSAFLGCTGLTSVTIPTSVANIKSNAFYNCKGLTSIISLASNPPILGGENVFSNTNNCAIIVPKGCGEVYKAAEYWSEYADRITEAS